MARRQNVTISGLGQLRAKLLHQVPAAVREASRTAVREETGEVTDDMRRGAPVDTGELAGSMQAEISADGLTGTAAATARHATFVEHGTEDTPDQPFAGPAAERSRQRFRGRVEDEIADALKGLTK